MKAATLQSTVAQVKSSHAAIDIAAVDTLPNAAVRIGPPRCKGASGSVIERTPGVGGKGSLEPEQRRGLVRPAQDSWYGGLVAVGAKRAGELDSEEYVNEK